LLPQELTGQSRKATKLTALYYMQL